jgi:DNA-binding winged helix-turn-helix (wHTH) protein/Tol biopolymer transport system component
MSMQLRGSPCLAFGSFEVDPLAGELRKGGVRVRLAGQPFQILLVLLAHPGEVVTREELRGHIWSDGTFVDFEHSLSAAINKLRRALGDSAENPRYIETVPGRGYRFIGSVQGIPKTAATVPVELPPAPVELPLAAAKSASKTAWLATGAAIGGVSVASLLIWMALQRPARRELRVQQLTTNSVENPIYHAVISPHGNYLAYGDAAGIHIRVINTGESHLLPKPRALSPDDLWFPVAWFPNETRIVAVAQSQVISAWSISVIGGAACRLRDNAMAYSVSPDGLLIAFTAGNNLVSPHNRPSLMGSEIWVMGPQGENARKVISGHSGIYFGSVEWSPDGKRVAYRKLSLSTQAFAQYTLETRDPVGGTPAVLVSSRESHFLTGVSLDVGLADNFCWTHDGRIIYAVHEPAPNHRDRNLWTVDVDANTGHARGRPHRLTNLAGFQMDSLSVTADGSRLMFDSGSDQSNVYVGRFLHAGNLETPRRLTFQQRYNSPYTWTPDSKAVIFRSDRTGVFSIYKQALDQQEAELIPTGSESIAVARRSPGGKWLIYTTLANVNYPDESELTHVMRAPISGGSPERLFECKSTDVNVSCGIPAGAPCVVSERNPQSRQVQFQRFDPATGMRDPIFTVTAEGENRVNWSISPNGSHLAIIGTDPRGGIEIRLLNGHIEREIESRAWPDPLLIDWSADDRAVIVEHFGLISSPSGPIGVTLLRVDLDGDVQPLWDTRAGRHAWAIPSPDGRYLAIRAPAVERNAWMVENF